jgi:hypothetical protein
MPNFTVIEKTQYDITADTVEEARERWLNSDWDLKLEDEPEICYLLNERGDLVWEP